MPASGQKLGETVSDFSAFGSMERRGWADATRAAGYVELFASASDQAIDSLLDAVGARTGIKALDLCCGQGNVSKALLRRGCEVVGIDFSPPMLAFARGRAPNANFIEADAQELPFDDAEFDVGRPDHLGPFLGLVGDESAEIPRRARNRNAAQIDEPRL